MFNTPLEAIGVVADRQEAVARLLPHLRAELERRLAAGEDFTPALWLDAKPYRVSVWPSSGVEVIRRSSQPSLFELEDMK